MKGVLATYSSSRCRCDSTMVMRKCGQGWEGTVGRKWSLCSCCALLSQEMSCADPGNTGEDELCTPMAGGWFCPDRLRLRRGERRNLPPNWLTPGTIEVESLQTSHQPSLHCIWRGERGNVNIRYAWQITWGVGGDENVYGPNGVLHQCLCQFIHREKSLRNLSTMEINRSKKQYVHCVFFWKNLHSEA